MLFWFDAAILSISAVHFRSQVRYKVMFKNSLGPSMVERSWIQIITKIENMYFSNFFSNLYFLVRSGETRLPNVSECCKHSKTLKQNFFKTNCKKMKIESESIFLDFSIWGFFLLLGVLCQFGFCERERG